MKKVTTSRSIVALMVIFFAVAATGCKKENEIVPNGTSPTVSIKPKSIITKEVGTPGNFRVQTYGYDSQNKLTKFISSSGTTRDSLVLFRDGIGFIRRVNGSIESKEFLIFNSDKSLKELNVSSRSRAITLTPVFATLQGSPVTLVGLNNSSINLGFTYLDNNVKSIGINTESLTYTYYNNLPFQKGINEMQVESAALMYHKVAEQENMTNYTFFSKLLHTVTVKDGNTVRRVDTYSYIHDEHGRVKTIIMNVDFPAGGSASQQFLSDITY